MIALERTDRSIPEAVRSWLIKGPLPPVVCRPRSYDVQYQGLAVVPEVKTNLAFLELSLVLFSWIQQFIRIKNLKGVSIWRNLIKCPHHKTHKVEGSQMTAYMRHVILHQK